VIEISYHISHEQFSPRELLTLVRQAEDAGFDAAFSSDHIQPWTPAQGHSGFIWSWLGAALQATQRLRFSGITVPGNWRYHPAVAAQAIATLGEMFPGRVPWFALGSGEALNECIVGEGWPEKEERHARLQEAADMMRALLKGERATGSPHIPAEGARLWSRPAEPTQLFGAALSETTAEWMGSWAEGLLTTAPDLAKLSRIVAAFGRHGRGKPMHAKVDLSWAPTEAQALAQAHEQWRAHAVKGGVAAELRMPEQFEDAARLVTPEQVRDVVLVSSSLQQHIEWLQERAALGFESLDLHNVGRNQSEFIEAFGRHVLPALR
jgi:coenzyme F420-dependent glucose-6-phosphate dehydrogenase